MESTKVGNVTVRLEQDTDCSSPRENDNLGTMVCFHRRYTLGDEHSYSDPQEFIESNDYKSAVVILPLGLIDHSGISMYVGSGAHSCDPGGWDSGQVGWIYVTRERARKEYGAKRITRKVREQIEKCLRAEVEEYDSYLTGDCYGYIVEDEEGNTLDSCWGFIGYKWAKEEALSAAKYQDEQLTKQAIEAEQREQVAVQMERECFAL